MGAKTTSVCSKSCRHMLRPYRFTGWIMGFEKLESDYPVEETAQPRLYSRFISIAKTLQIVSYLLTIAIVVFFLTTVQVVGAPVPISLVFFLALLIVAVIGFLYLLTQGLIAIVDLLSRIEQNSRSE